jgi:hypothetical protein
MKGIKSEFITERMITMIKYVVTFDKDCREELNKQGSITYEPDLVKDFLFYETEQPIDVITQIEGVTHVREQYMYSVNV